MKQYLKYPNPYGLWASMCSTIGIQQDPLQTILGKSMKNGVVEATKKLFGVMLLVMYSLSTSIIFIGAMPLFLFFLLASLATLSSAILVEKVERLLYFLIDQIDGM
jgi:hypothetical protein